MKTINTITCVFFLIILFSCNSKDKIVGEWECYGDPIYSEQLIKIEKIGKSFQGTKMNLIKGDAERMWNIGDVYWKNITSIENNKYRVSSVTKAVIYDEPKIKESDGLIELESEDILTFQYLVTDGTVVGKGKVRRFKRIK
jgi:hypothetical protein